MHNEGDKQIIIWSLGEEALDGKIDSMDAFETAKKAGFGGVELALHEGDGDTVGSDIHVVLDKGPRGGLKSSEVRKVVNTAAITDAWDVTDIGSDCLSTGLYWGYSLSANRKVVRDTAINIAKAQIEIASQLGMKYVLMVPGAVKVTFDPSSEEVSYKRVWSRASKAIGEELEPLAKKLGITICLENVGNDFLLKPGEFRKFVKQFDSPHVRMYFDMANVLYNSKGSKLGDPVYWVNELADIIARVHIKDYMRDRYGLKEIDGLGCYLGKGDVPLERTIDALKENGYDGSVTAEIMLFGKPKLWTEKVPSRTSVAMNKALGGVYTEHEKYKPIEDRCVRGK